MAAARPLWVKGLNRSRGRVLRGLLGRGPRVGIGASCFDLDGFRQPHSRPSCLDLDGLRQPHSRPSCLDLDGFRQPHSRRTSIPITEQAIGPLRQHTITGLTIRTSARLCRTPCKATNDLECDTVQWQMRRSSRLRHQFETAVFNDIASACPSLRTSQLRSCGM